MVNAVAVDEPKSGSDRSLVQPVILWGGLFCFVLVFGSYGFIAPWGGDINVYLAAVHALYRDLWHPSDISLEVPSGNMVFYGPYLVVVAAFGKLFDVTPYRALEFAGIVNVALYAAAITAFCRRFSRLPQSALPPLVLLAVILVLRVKIYSWSSETSYLTLGIIQAYASLLGWALALFSFVVADHVVEKPGAAAVGGLSLLLAGLVLIHPISASWAIGITGLRGLYVLLPGSIRHDSGDRRFGFLRRCIAMIGCRRCGFRGCNFRRLRCWRVGRTRSGCALAASAVWRCARVCVVCKRAGAAAAASIGNWT